MATTNTPAPGLSDDGTYPLARWTRHGKRWCVVTRTPVERGHHADVVRADGTTSTVVISRCVAERPGRYVYEVVSRAELETGRRDARVYRVGGRWVCGSEP